MQTNHIDRLALIYFKDSVDEDPLEVSYAVDGLLLPHFLTSLVLPNKNFCGEISQTIGHLLHLHLLHLGNNSFAGEMPTNLSQCLSRQCSNLEILYLIDNQLVGKIPNGLGSLSKLRLCGLMIFHLSFNQLTGEIPPVIFNITGIYYFSVDNNLLRGSIPPYVGDTLPSLTDLYFESNSFTGVIPPSLSNASGLQYIYFNNNIFHGPMPANLGRLKALKEMLLSSNQLRDDFSFITSLTKCSLPHSIGNLSNSARLISISGNPMYGTILQSQVGSLANLVELNLSYNKLTGPIPNSINKCLLLERLNLAVNSFHDEIPPVLGTLWGLQESMFPIMTSLYLNLSVNKFEAEVPKQGVFLSASVVSLFRAIDGFFENTVIGKERYETVYKGATQEGGAVAVEVLNLGHRGDSKSFVSDCNNFKALLYEYMANGSLENWIHQGNEEDIEHECERQREHGRSGHLGLMQRLDIAIDITSAIKYLHEDFSPKIIHRDLKPSNVLLDNEMTGRVGDFGLVKISSAATTEAMDINNHSSSMAVKGSLGYYGMGDMVSRQGDVYSCGILSLEMFTRRKATEEAFKDHLNLHTSVKVALTDRVMEIRMRDHVASILSTGVACSMESLRDWMDMAEALKELHKIRARHGSE
ncbi:hypothetical protein BT93_L1008 [Corymbia citriodora subsp. variegata]|uniref:Protein kinase domain-containing protein n=1 Tax=Corymbia citriodora subsp. variegata TaxID=360336 RepID=A0A8T0CQ32_CORYI|nr:hypothetical protein BT93_L1008 [Corymbia citriodora subsp. variegata]